MHQSISICTGLHAFDPTEYLTANTGWNIQDRLMDPCFIAGLTAVHKYDDPAKLLKVYQELRNAEFKATCNKRKDEMAEILKNKWGNYFTNFIKLEWETNFANYVNLMVDYTV